MNILQIEDTIKDLEDAPTTFLNAQNLAALYIVHDHMQKANLTHSRKRMAVSDNELADILPAYKSYIDEKIRYQSGNVIVDAVDKTLVLLCREIEDFILALYSDSESKQSRLAIEDMLEHLYTKLCS